MIYEWKCKTCGQIEEVERSIDDRGIPPAKKSTKKTLEEYNKGCAHEWVRVFNNSVPFQGLRDKGIFMDENGNYPPRKIEWQNSIGM